MSGVSDRMDTYLLSWNPAESPHDFSAVHLARLRGAGRLAYRWRTIRTKNFPVGSRVFVVRTGIDPKGIVASGWTTREPYTVRNTVFVGLEFDRASREPLIPLATLERDRQLRNVHWLVQGSGVAIPEPVAERLEARWAAIAGPRAVHEVPEVLTGRSYPEGASQRITVNAYERDPRARTECLRHHGTRCAVCDFDAGIAYGPEFEGLIHVHHIRELSAVGRRYHVNPRKDLVPLCPNCHAVAHSQRPALTVARITKMVTGRLTMRWSGRRR